MSLAGCQMTDWNSFEIVAHRGVPEGAPENTAAAFRRAVELGADAVELDVRLTSDRVPVIYHYYYLQEITSAVGPIFAFTLEQLQNVAVSCEDDASAGAHRISTLAEILDGFAGKIGLEIEVKGPEPEAAEIIGHVLADFRSQWHTMEATSYEPALLLAIQRACPGIAADLLYPLSEPWKGQDVVLYEAIHRSRLAHARAVHLHPTQLSGPVVSSLLQNGVGVHAWDVNDRQALGLAASLGIPRICTDTFRQAHLFREQKLKDGPRVLRSRPVDGSGETPYN